MKKNENNFKKAVNELLNLDFSGDKNKEQMQGSSEDKDNGQDSSSTLSENERREQEGSVFMPAAETEADRPHRSDRPSWETVITQDVIIEGNIISGSNLRILGKVQGNVDCEGTVVLTGSVHGDLSANSLEFQSGSINGNITVQEDMTVDKQTTVKGDITAGNAVFGGYAEGSFVIRDNLELRETAAIIGDIKADDIVMYKGSKVRGMLDVGGEIENINRGNGE